MTAQITSATPNRPPEIFRPATESLDWLQKISQIAKRSIKIFVAKTLVPPILARTLISPILLRLPSARSILPNNVTWLSEAFLAVPFRNFRDNLAGIFPGVYTTFKHGLKFKTNWTFILVASSLEEVVFRYGIQSLLLTAVPRLTLQKLAPSYEHLIDCKIAKIARIVFTSLLFALVHIVRLGNMPGMLLSQLLYGVYFSYMREGGTSITELSLIHFTINVIHISISGGLYQPPKPRLN